MTFLGQPPHHTSGRTRIPVSWILFSSQFLKHEGQVDDSPATLLSSSPVSSLPQSHPGRLHRLSDLRTTIPSCSPHGSPCFRLINFAPNGTKHLFPVLLLRVENPSRSSSSPQHPPASISTCPTAPARGSAHAGLACSPASPPRPHRVPTAGGSAVAPVRFGAAVVGRRGAAPSGANTPRRSRSEGGGLAAGSV